MNGDINFEMSEVPSQELSALVYQHLIETPACCCYWNKVYWCRLYILI